MGNRDNIDLPNTATLSYNCTVRVTVNGVVQSDFTNWTILSCQLRDKHSNLAATLTATWLDASIGNLKVYLAHTTVATLKVGSVYTFDILLADPSNDRHPTGVVSVTITEGKSVVP